MRITAESVSVEDLLVAERAALCVPLCPEHLADGSLAALDAALGGQLGRLRADGDLAAEPGEVTVLRPAAGPRRLVLVGVGPAKKATLRAVRQAAGHGARRAQTLRAGACDLWAHPGLAAVAGGDGRAIGRALADGAVLATFRDDAHRQKSLEKEAERPGPRALAALTLLGGASLLDELTEAARAAEALAPAIRTAKELGNLPGNAGPPRVLAECAIEMAKATGLRASILDEAALREHGMGAFLGVSQGSKEPPRLIALEHGTGRDEAPIVLVGKGITFDSGGISIKGSKGMEEMKFDMCGAAAVIGALEACARLGIPRRVVGLAACAENMPSASAQRPGDVCRTTDGQTVEIISTDAEGRMVLADTLAYAAREYAPAAIVDLATLTGACVVALGAHYAGLFTEDDALAAALRAAGEATGERCWRMPADPAYDEQLRSDCADVKNLGGRPAGAVTAARFLSRFVPDQVPWAHLDIAGVAWTTDRTPLAEPGATAFGVRLLAAWLEDAVSQTPDVR